MADIIIERAARAACVACGLDPDATSPKAAKAGHTIPEWMFFGGVAKAVLQAIREPSGEMVEAGSKIMFCKMGFGMGANEALYLAWQAMIDAALAGGE